MNKKKKTLKKKSPLKEGDGQYKILFYSTENPSKYMLLEDEKNDSLSSFNGYTKMLINNFEIIFAIYTMTFQKRFNSLIRIIWKTVDAIVFCFNFQNHLSFGYIKDEIEWLMDNDNTKNYILLGRNCFTKYKDINKDNIDLFVKKTNIDYIEVDSLGKDILEECYKKIGLFILNKQGLIPHRISNRTTGLIKVLPKKKKKPKSKCDYT